MLTELEPWLWIGGQEDCALAMANQRVNKSWALVVHSAKWPCHAKEVGYGYDTKVALHKEHPEYLWAERPGNLYLNLIDPPVPLFQVDVFNKALDVIAAHRLSEERGTKPQCRVLIHCNKGESRAPSLALLYLAKYALVIPDDSYAVARDVFLTKYPGYTPGAGIVTFLTEHWKEIA